MHSPRAAEVGLSSAIGVHDSGGLAVEMKGAPVCPRGPAAGIETLNRVTRALVPRKVQGIAWRRVGSNDLGLAQCSLPARGFPVNQGGNVSRVRQLPLVRADDNEEATMAGLAEVTGSLLLADNDSISEGGEGLPGGVQPVRVLEEIPDALEDHEPRAKDGTELRQGEHDVSSGVIETPKTPCSAEGLARKPGGHHVDALASTPPATVLNGLANRKVRPPRGMRCVEGVHSNWGNIAGPHTCATHAAGRNGEPADAAGQVQMGPGCPRRGLATGGGPGPAFAHAGRNAVLQERHPDVVHDEVVCGRADADRPQEARAGGQAAVRECAKPAVQPDSSGIAGASLPRLQCPDGKAGGCVIFRHQDAEKPVFGEDAEALAVVLGNLGMVTDSGTRDLSFRNTNPPKRVPESLLLPWANNGNTRPAAPFPFCLRDGGNPLIEKGTWELKWLRNRRGGSRWESTNWTRRCCGAVPAAHGAQRGGRPGAPEPAQNGGACAGAASRAGVGVEPGDQLDDLRVEGGPGVRRVRGSPSRSTRAPDTEGTSPPVASALASRDRGTTSPAGSDADVPAPGAKCQAQGRYGYPMVAADEQHQAQRNQAAEQGIVT